MGKLLRTKGAILGVWQEIGRKGTAAAATADRRGRTPSCGRSRRDLGGLQVQPTPVVTNMEHYNMDVNRYAHLTYEYSNAGAFESATSLSLETRMLRRTARTLPPKTGGQGTRPTVRTSQWPSPEKETSPTLISIFASDIHPPEARSDFANS